jgi:hypothetical protein
MEKEPLGKEKPSGSESQRPDGMEERPNIVSTRRFRTNRGPPNTESGPFMANRRPPDAELGPLSSDIGRPHREDRSSGRYNQAVDREGEAMRKLDGGSAPSHRPLRRYILPLHTSQRSFSTLGGRLEAGEVSSPEDTGHLGGDREAGLRTRKPVRGDRGSPIQSREPFRRCNWLGTW